MGSNLMKSKIMSVMLAMAFCIVIVPAVNAADTPKISENSASPSLVICGGAEGGRYLSAASDIAGLVKDTMTPRVEKTGGSMDNLKRLSEGTCDAGLAQRDAIAFQQEQDPNIKLDVDVAASLYAETMHLVCPATAQVKYLSGILKDPAKYVIFVGNERGGSWVTWNYLTKSLKGPYEKVPTVAIGGQRAITAVTNEQYEFGGKMAIPCLFWVGGVGASFMKDADDPRLHLVNLDDSGIAKILDRYGKPLYKVVTVPSGVYKNLDRTNTIGEIESYATDSVFLVRASWANDHDIEYGALLKRLRTYTAPK